MNCKKSPQGPIYEEGSHKRVRKGSEAGGSGGDLHLDPSL